MKVFFSPQGLSELVEWTFTLYEQKSKDAFKTPKADGEGAYTVHFTISF